MFELYGYTGEGKDLMATFETREELVRYMEENELFSDYEDGYFGLCPDGEEINL